MGSTRKPVVFLLLVFRSVILLGGCSWNVLSTRVVLLSSGSASTTSSIIIIIIIITSMIHARILQVARRSVVV
jgi:hypothetical protein